MAPTTRITRIAAGGDGIGTLPDGRAVFVPRTAPGDLVELTGLREHKRFARARIGRVVEPGPERVEPPCEHYVADECGGCQLQHLAQPAQLRVRRTIVGDALRRIGKLEVSDPEITPAPAALGYRAKLTLAVGDRRRRIGLHPYGRPDRVFDLGWCHITSPELNRLWQAVSRHRRLLPTTARRLVLRLDRQGGRHLLVRGDQRPAWTGGAALAAELDREGTPAAIWWHPEGGAPRAAAGAGEPFPASVFEQVNPVMGDEARNWALEQLGDVSGCHAWDLYAGIGESTDRLAGAGATVESVEIDARAVALAERRGGAPSPNVTRRSGRVEALLRTLRRPDVVVTNPPRTGMDQAAVTELARAAPSRIVYLSCDPATLARDIGWLGSGYRLAAMRAFDLFPQTAHVETVVVLNRA